MTALATAAIYAVLNSLILIWIANSTGSLRRRYKVIIGDGGVPHLTRIMRGHANAVENIPMFIVLLVLAALLNAPAIAIHVIGISFTVGRVLHAWHFVQEDAPVWQRFAGFGIAMLANILLALGVLAHAVAILIA